MPNYKKMAKATYEDAALALARLVSIDSVDDPSTKKEGAPFGEGVKKALDYVAALGEQYGFQIDRCDGYCTELSYGDDNGPLIGVYAHADVVPATGEWKSDPFKPVIREGRMWGRGTSDDKGPLIAALYAIKALKDNGLIRGYKVRLVAGGNEEKGTACLKYYFDTLKKPASDYGFTPDSEFPLIYAEKGTAGLWASRIIDLSPVTKMEGGAASNAVCDKLDVYLPEDKGFAEFLTATQVPFNESGEGAEHKITFLGKSAHGSLPHLGVNAALLAFSALGAYYKIGYLSQLTEYLIDPNGRNFGGYSKSKELGESTFNYGLISYSNKSLKISVDYRYGEEADPKAAIEAFEKTTRLTCTPNGEPHKVLLYPKDSKLVTTLMSAYRKATHRYFDKPLAIGGGTYAKSAANCVAFGSAFKNHPGDIHSPNEYIYMDDFYAQIAIYARAIHMLGGLSK